MVKQIILTLAIVLTLSFSAFAEDCQELKKENIKLKLSLLEQQSKLMQGQYEQLAKELKELEQVKVEEPKNDN